MMTPSVIGELEQAISIWQDTTGEPMTFEKVMAEIPYVPERFLPSPKAAPEL